MISVRQCLSRYKRGVYPGTRCDTHSCTDDITDNGASPRETNGNGARRREELADFLRKRRESIRPEDVGLPSGGRRRTPGLRREEVATLAGVGTTWYTWLEQGRDVRASFEVLEAIARALRLTPAERAHLMLLGRGEEAPPCKPPAERVTPSLRRLVENLGANPALVLGRRWDYLSWNRAACALFGDIESLPKAARNHLWLMFMDPARRELVTDWEQASRLAVARFRADSAHPSGRPLIRGADPGSAPVEPRVLQGVEAPRGGARERGPQADRASRGRDTRVRARGLPSCGGPRAAARLYTPVPEEDTPRKLAELLEAEPRPLSLAAAR